MEDVIRRAQFVGADVALCQHAAMRALTRVIERTERGDDENATATDVDDLTRAMDGVRLEEKITEEDFEVAASRCVRARFARWPSKSPTCDGMTSEGWMT